jgi:hypothetical protein
MGLPIAVALTGGEVSDFKGYQPVMDADGPAPKVLLADKPVLSLSKGATMLISFGSTW